MYKRKLSTPFYSPKKFSLNITSMADMFTILLVFLLQSYGLSEFKIDPNSRLELPISATMINPVENESLILTKSEILLGNKVILTLDQVQQIDSKIKKIDPLYIALTELKKQNPDSKKIQDGELIFQADRSHPYSYLQKVMFTASQAGFPKLKLATLSGE
jgi:biopolymer transport protein ExbD